MNCPICKWPSGFHNLEIHKGLPKCLEHDNDLVPVPQAKGGTRWVCGCCAAKCDEVSA